MEKKLEDNIAHKDKGKSPLYEGARIIKKYPNRRLYDTATSCYIALEDVRKMVISGENVRVLDAKTGEDLTRSMLLQIILEQEAAGMPLLSEAMLVNIIRFYGHSMQGLAGAYLEKNMQMLTDLQASFGIHNQQLGPDILNKMASVQSNTLEQLFKNYTQQSNSVLTNMQKQFLNAWGIKSKT